jgi:hypothetical protein
MTTALGEQPLTAEFTLEDLNGRWRSPVAAEVFPGIYGLDDFFLRSPFWGIHFNSYKDPECQTRLFELIISGMFYLQEPSALVPGARNVNFSRVITCLRLHDAGLVDGANAQGDGQWRAGQWRNASVDGCHLIDLPGTFESPIEYDMLGLARATTAGGAAQDSVDKLFFGQRNHDETGSIWTRRAPGLLDYYVVRYQAGAPTVGHGGHWGPEQWTRVTSDPASFSEDN